MLLNLDFDASIKAFKDLGSDGEVLDHKNGYADPVFYNLEIGKIAPAEFFNTIRKLLNNSSATDQIANQPGG